MTIPTPILETERLILRPLELADAEQIQKIFPKWEIVQYLNPSIPWPYPEDGALGFIKTCLDQSAEGTHMHWTIRENTAPEKIIGRIDIRYPDGETTQRGFWLDVPYWGKGYMTEAANSVTAFAFNELGFEYFIVSNAQSNEGSSKIKNSQGAELLRVGAGKYMAGTLPEEIWKITPGRFFEVHPELETKRL